MRLLKMFNRSPFARPCCSYNYPKHTYSNVELASQPVSQPASQPTRLLTAMVGRALKSAVQTAMTRQCLAAVCIAVSALASRVFTEAPYASKHSTLSCICRVSALCSGVSPNRSSCTFTFARAFVRSATVLPVETEAY